MAEQRRIIRFFPDHGNPWPLWESFTDEYVQTPERLGLSADLTNSLRDWYAFWLEHCSIDTGWTSTATHHWYLQRGQELAARVSEEISAFAEVSVEL